MDWGDVGRFAVSQAYQLWRDRQDTRRRENTRRRLSFMRNSSTQADNPAYKGSDGTDFQKETNVTYNVIKLGRKRSVDAIGRWSYLYQNQGSLIINTARQGVADMAYHGHLEHQWLSSNHTVNTILPAYQWRESPFQLNPFNVTTGSDVIGVDAHPANHVVFVESCMASMQIVNSTNIPVVCEIYFCTPKQATAGGPKATWETVLAEAGDVQSDAVNPTTIAGTLTAGSPSLTTYGQNPGYEPVFNKIWQIVLRKRIVLAGGSSHDLRYKIWFNKFLRSNYLRKLIVSGSEYAPGISLIPMVVARPGPVVFTEGDSSFGYDKGYTTSEAKIGWVYSHRYKYCALPATNMDINRAAPQFVAIDTSIPGNTLKIIDTEDNTSIVERA